MDRITIAVAARSTRPGKFNKIKLPISRIAAVKIRGIFCSEAVTFFAHIEPSLATMAPKSSIIQGICTGSTDRGS